MIRSNNQLKDNSHYLYQNKEKREKNNMIFTYPSLSSTYINYDMKLYVFDKIDGTNIQVEWNDKTKFKKFSTRRFIINRDTYIFGKAIEVIKSRYENEITRICKSLNWKRCYLFFELYGLESFSGYHNESDEFNAILFDVWSDETQLLSPDKFIEYFGNNDIVKIPKLLHIGKIDDDFVNKVKEGKLEGIGNEGVVCKGFTMEKGKMKLKLFKIKRIDWIEKLKSFCNGDEEMFSNLL